jgi:hypothetical protein
MRNLHIAALTVLAFLAPTATVRAAEADEDALEALAADMMHRAGPLRWFHVEDELWKGINEEPEEIKFDQAQKVIEEEIRERYRQANDDEIWAMVWRVGLIPSNCNIRDTYFELLTEDLVAVYDYGSKRIKVVERGDDAPPALARKLQLMHEVGNALDHRHVYNGNSRNSIDDKTGKSHDGRLGVICMLDGSGRFLSKRYLHRAQRLKLIPRSETNQYADYQEARGKRFLQLPAYFQAFLGAQVCGMRFFMGGRAPSAITDESVTGQEELLAVGEDMIQSTEQAIHPEKFLDPEKRDFPIDVEEAYANKFMGQAPGCSVVYNKDTLGELLCAVLARSHDPDMNPMALTQPDYYTTEAASGWGGDRFFVVQKGGMKIPVLGRGTPEGTGEPENIRGIWVTVWDTPKDRTEFIEAYDKHVPMKDRVTVELGERTACFLYGFEGDEVEKITEKMRKQPPKLKQKTDKGMKNVDP